MITRRNFLLGAASSLPFLYSGNALSNDKTNLKKIIQSFPQLYTIQVKKGADLVFSAAARGRSFEKDTNIKSCSKSLLGLMLGAALDRGDISSIKLTLSDLIPHLLPKNVSSTVANITLEELVSLTAPLASTSIGNYGHWISSKNWLNYVLTKPNNSSVPGQMIYSTGSTHLLGVALSEATKKNLHTLARRYLGKPMKMGIAPWTRDPQGYYLGGNEMAISPHSMLDIATMVRDEGMFRGKRIISKKWIEQSIIPRTYSPHSQMNYGYGWFLSNSGYILARGYGGQIIAAHKEKDLALAITSSPWRPATTEGYFGDLVRLLEGPILSI